MKWTGKGKYPPEQEMIRRMVMAEAEADYQHRKRLQDIKDRLDLYGEGALEVDELLLVGKHHDFFFPEEG